MFVFLVSCGIRKVQLSKCEGAQANTWESIAEEESQESDSEIQKISIQAPPRITAQYLRIKVEYVRSGLLLSCRVCLLADIIRMGGLCFVIQSVGPRNCEALIKKLSGILGVLDVLADYFQNTEAGIPLDAVMIVTNR
jgi:hypothetical protein